jgi:hypothetical protein
MIGERTYGIMLVFQPHQSCWEITADDYLEGVLSSYLQCKYSADI